MIFSEITENQSRIIIDTIQLYEAYLNAFHQSLSYKGGMHWKKSNGKEYLFKTIDRNGNGKSLGPRNRETESTFTTFHKGKQQAKTQLKSLRFRLNEQARICKAVKVNRTPKIVTQILSVLDQNKLSGKGLVVIGTNVMYAYEILASVYLDAAIMATQDLDLMWDTRTKLTLFAIHQMNNEGLLGLLKQVDKSFEMITSKSFRAVNKEGYMVDLVQAEPKSIAVNPPGTIGNDNDIHAAPVKNLQWLISSPKVKQTIIGNDGYPANIVVPDPRAFVLHKIWLSSQIDRDAIKKKRDFAQGVAIAKLIMTYLPQYPFNPRDLRLFPKQTLHEIQANIKTEISLFE
jgi:hypothetical protein